MSKRPRCSVFIAVSVDGCIARADGSLDWLEIVQLEGEDYGYAEFAASVDVLVIGRKTYEVACGFDEWPYAGKRCVVLTRHSRTALHGEEFYGGSLSALVDRLGNEGARRVYVDGGSVIRQFLAERLLDDLTLSIVPIVLGAGIPLFATGEVLDKTLTLESTRSWPTGLVQLRYRVSAT